MKHEITVITQVPSAPVPLVMHVLAVDVDQGPDWVKRHADEIAANAVPGKNVVALWVGAPGYQAGI